LTLDQSGNPVVLFSEGSDNAPTQLFIKRWTSEGWQRLGEQINPVLSYALAKQVVVNANNNPTIAYSEYATLDDFINAETPEVIVKQWTGTSWQQVTRFADDSLGFNQLDLKTDGQHLLRLWDGDSIIIRNWSGKQWATLKTVPWDISPVHENAETYVYDTAIDLDAEHNPFIAWIEHDYTDGKQSFLYIKRWNGTTWELLGSEPVHRASSVWWPEIILKIAPDNKPIVVFTEGNDESATRQIYVKDFDSGWQTLGAGSLNINKSSEALLSGLEFDAQSKPIVSWTEGNKAYAGILQNSKWNLVGGSSLNQNNQNETHATVYANSQGSVFKVLHETVSGVFQLFTQLIP
jgi:hypothetical protein